jgi:hypothetical protein
MRFIQRRTVMRVLVGSLLSAVLLVASQALLAQAVDPSGHWEGAVQMAGQELRVEFDLAKNAKGELVGTFSQPLQGVKGLPLSSLSVEGRSVRFALKAGPDVSTFVAALSADGKTLAGDASQRGESAPFSLTRTGDARIAAAPKNAAIGKQLEGTWNGTLDLGDRQMRLVVKMANQPGGGAAGTVMSPDGSGVEIPIAMAQKDASVTIDVPSVGAGFAGAFNAERTEIAGTWTQGGSSLPLTLRRDK